MAAHAPRDRREQLRWLLFLGVAAIVAIVVRLHALEVGLLSDDYMQYAMIAGLYPGEGYAPFDLYAFVRQRGELSTYIDEGLVPWFAEPDFHGSVFRPLASLLLWLDHTVAPGNLRLWHAHSLVWMAATIVTFGLCARRLLPLWPAAIAVVLLVCEGGFVSPIGWLANRCTLLSTTFGFAATLVHLEWRRPGADTPAWVQRHGPQIELALFAASLAGGEYGLGLIAYVFAWELVCGGREGTTPADPWSTRARALVPAGVATAGYLALHQTLGYGTFGANVYADPLHDPRGWFAWTILRIPKLCMGALWALPADTVSVFQHPGAAWWDARWPAHDLDEAHLSHRNLSLFGVAVAGVGLLLARAGLHDDERRALRVALLGGFFTLLPVSVAPAHSRLLLPAQLGACVAVALLVVACVRLLRDAGAPTRRIRGLVLLPILAVMLAFQTYHDLRGSQGYLLRLEAAAEADVLAFTRGDLLAQPLAGRDVVVLNGPTQVTAMYGHFLLAGMGYEPPASWRPLGLGGEHAMVAKRIDVHTLELSTIQGAWLETAGELFFRRSDRPLPAGSKFRYPGMDVDVIEDRDGRPTRVRFRFPHDLDDPRYLFLASTPAGLNRWPVPPIGGVGAVPLPRVPFPEHLIPLEMRPGAR